MEGRMQDQIEGALLAEADFNNGLQIETAMNMIIDVMLNEKEGKGSYAHSWHDNIAMACYDAMCRDNYSNSRLSKKQKRAIANDAATSFMKACFNVTTGQ